MPSKNKPGSNELTRQRAAIKRLSVDTEQDTVNKLFDRINRIVEYLGKPNVKLNNKHVSELKRVLKSMMRTYTEVNEKLENTKNEIKKLQGLGEINLVLAQKVYKLDTELELNKNNMKNFPNLGKSFIDPDSKRNLASSLLYSEMS